MEESTASIELCKRHSLRMQIVNNSVVHKSLKFKHILCIYFNLMPERCAVHKDDCFFSHPLYYKRNKNLFCLVALLGEKIRPSPRKNCATYHNTEHRTHGISNG